MSRPSVLVVGGGVIGAACAYELAKRGRAVTVLDVGKFGAACSHGNCGLVSPSHVLPLAVPGVVRATMKAMLAANSPFKIRPRLSRSFLSWMWRFTRRCNTRDMLESAVGIRAMLNSSRRLYEELIRGEDLECEFERRGVLFVYQTPEHFEHYADTNRLLTDTFETPAVKMGRDELLAAEPALRPEAVAGAWLYESDAHLRPDRLMKSWRKKLDALGVTIIEDCQVSAIEREGRSALGVRANGQSLRADQLLFATGAMTPLLSGELGIKVPIQPGKGYSITLPRPDNSPTRPMIFEEHRVAVTPMRTGLRVGSTMEFAGYDSTMNPARLGLLTRAAKMYLKELPQGEKLDEWWGWRPMTTDSRPILDRVPAFENVFVAAGHNMLGLSMAPATGKFMAELMAGEPTHIDPAPYRLGR